MVIRHHTPSLLQCMLALWVINQMISHREDMQLHYANPICRKLLEAATFQDCLPSSPGSVCQWRQPSQWYSKVKSNSMKTTTAESRSGYAHMWPSLKFSVLSFFFFDGANQKGRLWLPWWLTCATDQLDGEKCAMKPVQTVKTRLSSVPGCSSSNTDKNDVMTSGE